MNQSILLSDSTMSTKKQLKIDKMKIIENDENSQPKPNILHR
jgi:hypothetical protein